MNKNQLIHWTSAMLFVCAWADSSSAHAIQPILEFKFTDGSSANTGSGAQTASAQAPGQVVASGGLDGSGCYQNHAPPADGVNFQSQFGRFMGSGLDNDLRSITLTLWLKADVPFANSPRAFLPLFDTAGFSFVSRGLPDGAGGQPGEFGVGTGNATQPAILFQKGVAATPAFGVGDVGEWRFVALTLDMQVDGDFTVSTVNLYRGSLTDPVALWGSGTRRQEGKWTTQINNAFAVGNHRNGDTYADQRQFLGEIDEVRFHGSGQAGEAVLDLAELEALRTSVLPSTNPAFIRGDCNGDGQVIGSTGDAVFLLAYSFVGGPPPPCFAACDIDGDTVAGRGVTDAVYLLQFNFLGGPAPPAPFPLCGPGNANDAAIGCATPPDACR